MGRELYRLSVAFYGERRFGTVYIGMARGMSLVIPTCTYTNIDECECMWLRLLCECAFYSNVPILPLT